MNLIQQKVRTFKFTDRILDLFLLFIAARIAIVFERIYHLRSWHALDEASFNFYALILIFILWAILIKIFENDLIYRSVLYIDIIKNIVLISFIGVTTIITIDFLLNADFFKRSTISFFGFISFFLLLLKRICLKYFLSTIRKDGFDTKNILLIGSHKRARRVVCEFEKHKEYGLKISAILDPDPSRIGVHVEDMRVLGDISNYKEKIKDYEIDEVFFAIDLNLIQNIHEIFTYLNEIGIKYHMVINESVHAYVDVNSDVRTVASSFYGMSMLSFNSNVANYFKLYIKELMEKVIAFSLLILTSPLLLIFAFLVKSTSSGPILFKQQRVGLNGRKFYQYKLRSMVEGAEKLKNKYSHLNEQSGPVFKIKNDPRLTYIGKFMRKYSIDELPQLINVLFGSMTLIGPRPLPVSEVDSFDKDYLHRRHSMKPGVTGLWQVNGRNKIKDFNKWVKLDMEYIDNWSFFLDFKIALKTIYTVISGTGL